MAHVASVPRSIAFYEQLGFEVHNVFTPPEQPEPSWAWLQSGGACLMVVRASHPVDAAQQAIIFTLYGDDVPGIRTLLQERGLAVGELEYPSERPRGKFRMKDPDGYDLTITHT
jgi:hypothetical protein